MGGEWEEHAQCGGKRHLGALASGSCCGSSGSAQTAPDGRIQVLMLMLMTSRKERLSICHLTYETET